MSTKKENCRTSNHPGNDPINPIHYKHGDMEVIDALKGCLTKEEFKGFCKGLIVKYTFRADYKNGSEDYNKAIWYLKKLVEVENENSEYCTYEEC